MFPNTLKFYAGALDNQANQRGLTGTVSKVSDDGGTSEYRLALDNGARIGVMVQHSVQNQKSPGVPVDRHTVRATFTKLNEASGVEDVCTASFQVAASRRSFTKDEVYGVANALLNVLFPNDENMSADNVILGGTFPIGRIEELLSGAI